MKRWFIIFLLSLCVLPLFALTHDYSLGYRRSTTYEIVYPEYIIDSEKFKASIRTLGLNEIDLHFTYKIMEKKFNLYTGLDNQIYDNFSAVSASAFFIAKYVYTLKPFSFKAGAGVQISLFKTKYVTNHMLSFLPIILAEVELKLKDFSASVYVDTHSYNDMSWRSYPCYGVKFAYDIKPNLSIYSDIWAKASEYWVDEWRMINGYGFKLGVKFDL